MIKKPATLRILQVHAALQVVRLVIPAWSPNQEILYPLQDIPRQFHDKLFPGANFRVLANMSAPTVERLALSNFQEIPVSGEYLVLLQVRETLSTTLTYLRPEVNPHAYSEGLFRENMEMLEKVCEILGEPLPAIWS